MIMSRVILVRMAMPGHMLSTGKIMSQVNLFNSSLDSLLYKL